MSVYYIHAPESGLVKIGFAENPRSRLGKMQVDSPTRLVLLAVEEGGLAVEAERHARFAAYRSRGEWFDHCGELADYIDTLTPYERPARKFGPTEMSALTGWTKGWCSQMLNGLTAITLERAAHIYRTCGRKMGPLSSASDEDCEVVLRLCPPVSAEAVA